MVSPSSRREVVERVRHHFPDISERRACRVIGLSWSTHRYEPKEPNRDHPVVKRMLELSRGSPRYGYRRIGALLRGEGMKINAKRVYRLWCKEGLKVPIKQVKKRRLGSSEGGCIRRHAEHKDQVWCYDFVHDTTVDGKTIRLLPIVDEFTRECLALEVERSFKATEVIGILKYLFEVRGAPRYIRSDNGPEFISQAIRSFLAESRVGPLYIEPGSPWENGYAESFNSHLGDELLKREMFGSLKEAKVICEDYRLDYNHRRPHSSLGYVAPAKFASSCVPPAVGLATLALPPATHTTGHTQPTLIPLGT